MIAEIIAIGSELLTPFRQDTNSLYLTEKLNQLGVQVAFKTVVGDDAAHLVLVARTAIDRADIVILMGGLGPTEDDLTRQCVAEATGRALRRDSDLIAALYARFAARQRKMSPNNEQQADVIEGAESIPNELGTAPGQWLELEHEGQPRVVMLLPGPPYELFPMFEQHCHERLRAKLPPAHLASRFLRVAMMPESQVDARIAPIYKRYSDIQTTILSSAGDIELHFVLRGENLASAQARVNELADAVEEELGDVVYSNRGEKLEQIVGYYLQMRGATVAVAESCTGGLLGARISSVPGSSRYFLGGAITYANELKTTFAGVPPLMIQAHGAVSREVAAAMAETICHDCNATLGVGITGVAGPGGGSEDKPVGLVYHAIHDGKRTDIVERTFPGDRDRIRLWATQQALDMIRRKLM